MPLLAEVNPNVALGTAFLLAIFASVVAWVWIATNWRRGEGVFPYQPRRPVPWTGADVGLILGGYIVSSIVAVMLTWAVLGRPVEKAEPPAVLAPQQQAQADNTDEHPVARLVLEGDMASFLIALAVAAIIAPLVEEFLFRVVLQGWLEAVDGRWRRRWRALRSLPRAAVPIIISSAVFAALHFRTTGPAAPMRVLVLLLVVQGVLHLAVVFLAILWLRLFHGATAEDLGWQPRELWADIGRGLVAAVAVCPPTYLLVAVSSQLVPKGYAPDPIPIFFFALALGTIYFRTHRIVAPAVLHVSLNTISLVAAWLLMRG